MNTDNSVCENESTVFRVGDLLTFKAATRYSYRKATRKITGYGDLIMIFFEFCEKYHISPAKARRMFAEGLLEIDAPPPLPPMVTAIYQTLARGQSLTAAHLVELIENPDMIPDLGYYADRAKAEIAALGKIEPAPKAIVAYVTDAAKNEPEAVDVLLGWLREILPAAPVGHAFIAVRLLLGLAPNIRQYDVPRIPRALLNCRLREEFAGWWRVEKRGSRNVTIYCRPAKITLDL